MALASPNLDVLIDGGNATAAEVTVEEMARRFAHGVIEALR